MITQREVICIKAEEVYTQEGPVYNYQLATKVYDPKKIDVDSLIQIQLSSSVKDLFRVGKLYSIGVEQLWQPQISQPPSQVSQSPAHLKQ